MKTEVSRQEKLNNLSLTRMITSGTATAGLSTTRMISLAFRPLMTTKRSMPPSSAQKPQAVASSTRRSLLPSRNAQAKLTSVTTHTDAPTTVKTLTNAKPSKTHQPSPPIPVLSPNVINLLRSHMHFLQRRPKPNWPTKLGTTGTTSGARPRKSTQSSTL